MLVPPIPSGMRDRPGLQLGFLKGAWEWVQSLFSEPLGKWVLFFCFPILFAFSPQPRAQFSSLKVESPAVFPDLPQGFCTWSPTSPLAQLWLLTHYIWLLVTVLRASITRL